MISKEPKEDTTQNGQSESKKTRIRIIKAGRAAVQELIKVAEEPIINDKGMLMEDGEGIPMGSDALSADKLKNAAATKKLAIFDAFEILTRIESEEESLRTADEAPTVAVAESKLKKFSGFAEGRSSK
jgi:hypothetical protein